MRVFDVAKADKETQAMCAKMIDAARWFHDRMHKVRPE
jgi:hypothetical protein